MVRIYVKPRKALNFLFGIIFSIFLITIVTFAIFRLTVPWGFNAFFLYIGILLLMIVFGVLTLVCGALAWRHRPYEFDSYRDAWFYYYLGKILFGTSIFLVCAAYFLVVAMFAP